MPVSAGAAGWSDIGFLGKLILESISFIFSTLGRELMASGYWTSRRNVRIVNDTQSGTLTG
jgi:hypothetical protein